MWKLLKIPGFSYPNCQIPGKVATLIRKHNSATLLYTKITGRLFCINNMNNLSNFVFQKVSAVFGANFSGSDIGASATHKLFSIVFHLQVGFQITLYCTSVVWLHKNKFTIMKSINSYMFEHVNIIFISVQSFYNFQAVAYQFKKCVITFFFFNNYFYGIYLKLS